MVINGSLINKVMPQMCRQKWFWMKRTILFPFGLQFGKVFFGEQWGRERKRFLREGCLFLVPLRDLRGEVTEHRLFAFDRLCLPPPFLLLIPALLFEPLDGRWVELGVLLPFALFLAHREKALRWVNTERDLLHVVYLAFPPVFESTQRGCFEACSKQLPAFLNRDVAPCTLQKFLTSFTLGLFPACVGQTCTCFIQHLFFIVVHVDRIGACGLRFRVRLEHFRFGTLALVRGKCSIEQFVVMLDAL